MREARRDIECVDKWTDLAWQAGFRAPELSRLFNVCPRQLRRYTRRLFGCSPQEWLSDQRLLIAPGMLKKNRSVKTVAVTLNFKQVSHFSREFKLRYGVSPKAFLDWSQQKVTQLNGP